MTNPIDVIAGAIRIALGEGGSTDDMAEAVVQVLTDEAIVANAMAAVRAHSWTAEDVEEIPNRQLHAIVRIVLSSVAGGT